MSESDDGAWQFVMLRGQLVKRRPWCDCKKKGWGYMKRADGCWVRPCCQRREKAAWERWGDTPIPPDYIIQKEQGVHSVNAERKHHG